MGKRIVGAEHETNYRPACQTAGRQLADRTRALVLEEDWPKTLEALECRPSGRREGP